MQKLQITELSYEQYLSDINELKSLIKKREETSLEVINDEVYYTRKRLAAKFDVELSTIHNWVKKGILKSYGICGRVYFKKSEVENALVPLNS